MLKSLLSLYGFLLVLPGFAQMESDIEKNTDSILKVWDDSEKPGIAVGILKKGKVIYLKGFGAANLQTKTPITLQTKFQVDDLAKQFTVLAMFLLEEQGKISFDDDIREYIPELPAYNHKITLNHLLNHSTGLNDYSMIKELIGWRPKDILTHQDALTLISSQKQLSYRPGTDFGRVNSDTEFTLMAEVIKKASGESLVTFTRTYIFEPLKMKNSIFSDDHEMNISGLAESYQQQEDSFKKNVLNNGNAGPTNLYTSAEDLAIWYSQFGNTDSGIAKTIRKLHTLVKLDDGKTYNSSWGSMTLARDFFHKERGIPAYWQFGLTGGYGANMFIFPEQKIISFALGNNNQYNGLYAMAPVEPLLKDHYIFPPVVDFKRLKTKKLSQKKLAVYEGHYWDAKAGYARKIHVESDTLRYYRPEQDRASALVPLGDDTFQMVVGSDDIVKINFERAKDSYNMIVVSGESDQMVHEAYDPVSYSQDDLAEFTGIFYNSFLNTTYTFSQEGGKLMANHLKSGRTEFTSIKKDIFQGNREFFGSINFIRDGEKNILGFRIVTNGITNLEFKKVS